MPPYMKQSVEKLYQICLWLEVWVYYIHECCV